MQQLSLCDHLIFKTSMGRTARNYPKGKLKLRTPKEVQPGKRYPIYIEYNWQADSLRKTTEVSVFPKDWNENGYGRIGEIRATTDLDYKYYNAVLHKRLADTDAKIMQYYEKNGHVTGDVYKNFRENGGVVGRKQGYTKSDDKMKQQYSQEIKLLRKGLSLREVSKLTGHSVNTIRKVSHFV